MESPRPKLLSPALLCHCPEGWSLAATGDPARRHLPVTETPRRAARTKRRLLDRVVLRECHRWRRPHRKSKQLISEGSCWEAPPGTGRRSALQQWQPQRQRRPTACTASRPGAAESSDRQGLPVPAAGRERRWGLEQGDPTRHQRPSAGRGRAAGLSSLCKARGSEMTESESLHPRHQDTHVPFSNIHQ